jgi:hypothetical protein
VKRWTTCNFAQANPSNQLKRKAGEEAPGEELRKAAKFGQASSSSRCASIAAVVPAAAASKAAAGVMNPARNAAAMAKGERANMAGAAGGSPGRKRADMATTWAPSHSRFRWGAQENRGGIQAGPKQVYKLMELLATFSIHGGLTHKCWSRGSSLHGLLSVS